MTGKLIVPAPSSADASPIVMLGTPSSLTMVPWPVPSAMVAFAGLLRFTAKVSSASAAVSPVTLTVTCCMVTPGVNVRVPLAGTKSSPSVVTSAAA